jgi:hypothetical protein
VLAVGDEAFQRKSLDRVAQFQRDGRTIVVVSHSPDLVRRICQAAAVLDHGRLVSSGDTDEAVKVFREHLRMTPPRPRPGEPPPVDDRVRITAVEFRHPGQPTREYLEPGEPLEIRAHFEVDAPVHDPVFTLMIYDREGGLLHGSSTATEPVTTGYLDGPGEVVFAFDQVPLLDGVYSVTLCATSHDGAYIYDWHEQRYQFEVRDPDRGFGSVDFPVTIRVVHEPVAKPSPS